jgi:acetolactate synthase-1/2/3 large subunit
MGFAARLVYRFAAAHPFRRVTGRARLGYATALGVQDALRDRPVAATGDGGWIHRQRLATASITASARVWSLPTALGDVAQEERLVSADRLRSHQPDFVRMPRWRSRRARPRSRRVARGAQARSNGAMVDLIEVPVGPLPSPWEFIVMPRLRRG